MIYTTSGDKTCRAINAESVKEQVLAQMLAFGNNDTTEATNKVLRRLLETIDELPTLDTLDGKKMKRAYYPRIMVKDSFSLHAEPFQIGGNTHHQLEVRHTEDGSYLCFINTQGMVGTDYADEGYTFIGEKTFDENGDNTEIVPFDEVWIEDEKEEQHG